jgi:hypothetical protein
MRHAVKKPRRPVHTQALKAVSPAEHTPKMSPAVRSMHKVASQSVNISRLAKAKQVQRPAVIQHFSNAEPAFVPVSQSPVTDSAPQPGQNAGPAPHASESAQSEQPQSIFEQALALSKSHEETFHGPVAASKKTKRKQHAAFGALFMLALVVAALVAYVNVPNINMAVASARAGFHAITPSYVPSGFSATKYDYSSGIVSIQYKAHVDERNFTITQKASDWDSQALLANFVSLTNQNYRTEKVNGRSVYLYGNGNATLVDGGIWFTVTSNGNVPDHQLLDIAATL